MHRGRPVSILPRQCRVNDHVTVFRCDENGRAVYTTQFVVAAGRLIARIRKGGRYKMATHGSVRARTISVDVIQLEDSRRRTQVPSRRLYLLSGIWAAPGPEVPHQLVVGSNATPENHGRLLEFHPRR